MSENKNLQEYPHSEEKEVNIISLLKVIWIGRKTVLKTMAVFILVGFFMIVFSEKEYTASTTMVPKISGKLNNQNYSGLASLAGLNLKSSENSLEVPPYLYPAIVSSIPFKKELMNTPLSFEGYNEKITFKDYYTNIYNPGILYSIDKFVTKYVFRLPYIIAGFLERLKERPSSDSEKNSVTSHNLLIVDSSEREFMGELERQVIVTFEDKFIKLDVKMPEALASAQMAKRVQDLLQEYITNFKVKKYSEELEFVKERLAEKKEDFIRIQEKMAKFIDQNQNLNSTLAKSRLQRLQSGYDLAYVVYTDLARELERKEIKLKEEIPVFMIIEPVSIPYSKSKPKKSLIFISSVFFGFLFGIGLVFLKPILSIFKGAWKDNNNER